MEEEPDRFLRVKAVPSREVRRRKEAFALQQPEERVRGALEWRRPFRGIKDALQRFPEVRSQWFACEEGRLPEHARDWSAGEGVEADLVSSAPAPAAPGRAPD